MTANTKKFFIISGICATALLLFRKAKSAVDFYRALSITPRLDSLKKIKFSGSSLNVPIAIDFQNRSANELTVGLPNVLVYFKEKQVSQINPNNVSVTIKQYAKSTLSGISLSLPLLQLISVAGQMISSIITNGDYNQILQQITLKITLLINNKYHVPVTVQLGKETEVEEGIGLIPYSERKISSINDYVAYIPPKTQLKYTNPVLIPNGSVSDTVELMHKVVRDTYNDTKNLANWLKCETLKETCKAIFDFVYQHIAYERDSVFQEQVRRPLRTLYDQKGDCDCYATLIGSILYNLRIPFKFRIAEYNNKGYYQHVYVIVPYSNGYYTIDPVLDHFNEEKPFTKNKDF